MPLDRAAALRDGAAVHRLVPAPRPRGPPLHVRPRRRHTGRYGRARRPRDPPRRADLLLQRAQLAVRLRELLPLQAAPRPRRVVGRHRHGLPSPLRLRRRARLQRRDVARRRGRELRRDPRAARQRGHGVRVGNLQRQGPGRAALGRDRPGADEAGGGALRPRGRGAAAGGLLPDSVAGMAAAARRRRRDRAAGGVIRRASVERDVAPRRRRQGWRVRSALPL